MLFMNTYKRKNSISNSLLVVIVSIVFVLIIALGVTFAWLTDSFKDEGGGTIGEVGIEIYSGETLISGKKQENGTYLVGTTLEVVLSDNLNTATPINLSVKNTGNIPGIVKCLIVVTADEVLYDHEENELKGAYNIIQTAQVSVNQSGWVTLFDNELIDDQNFFNSFYNSKLEGGATQSVISSLTPLVEGTQSSKVFVFVRAEIVAYSGNAYQVDSVESPVEAKDKPFGVLSSEFLKKWTAWQ